MATFGKSVSAGATENRSQLRLAMALIIATIALAVIGAAVVTNLPAAPAVIEGSQDTMVFEPYRDAGLRQLDAARSQSGPAFEPYRDAGLRQLDAARSQSAFDCLLRNKIDDC